MSIDSGEGLTQVVPQQRFRNNNFVLAGDDEFSCYSCISQFVYGNTNTDGWAGELLFSIDGGPWTPGTCASGCAELDTSTEVISADGNTSPRDWQARMSGYAMLMNSNFGEIEPPVNVACPTPSPTSVPTTPEPTAVPTTSGPTAAPSTSSPTSSPTTFADVIPTVTSWNNGCQLKVFMNYNVPVSSWSLELEFGESVPENPQVWKSIVSSLDGTTLILDNAPWNGNQNLGDNLTIGMNLANPSVCASLSSIKLNSFTVWEGPLPTTSTVSTSSTPSVLLACTVSEEPSGTAVATVVPTTTNVWGAGCSMQVNLNFSQSVTAWTIALHYDESIESSSVWNGRQLQSQDSTIILVENEQYNGVKQAGEVVEVGMNIGQDGTECSSIACISINGEAAWSNEM